MIKFSLKCAEGHGFESWFKTGAAFDDLNRRGFVACPVCGNTSVTKAMMAPAVAMGRAQQDTPPVIAAQPSEAETKLKELRAQVEANSEYVGTRFATEARAMYLGDTPDRPIYGEAAPEDAKALLQEGVPVLPLPFLPTRKTN
jgi:hypothetical protein